MGSFLRKAIHSISRHPSSTGNHDHFQVPESVQPCCFSFSPLVLLIAVAIFDSPPAHILSVFLLLGFLVLFLAEQRKKRKYLKKVKTLEEEMVLHREALSRSEDKYNHLMRHIHEGLIITDTNNRILFANPSACTLLHADAEFLINKPLKGFIFGELEVLKTAGEEKESPLKAHREEVQMVRADSQIIWVRLSISYSSSAGNPGTWGAVIVLSDIHKKKQAEQERNALTADLNQKIRQLHCLFDIQDITGTPGITFDGIFNRCLEVIPNGLKYTHDVCVEISFEEKRYASANYMETPWTMTVPIRVQKKRLGQIKIGYLEEKPRIKKDPFHINEKILLKNIAEKLGQIIESQDLQQNINTPDYGKSIADK